ncbi:L-threonine O-3-phosphate decarboxylase [Yoonia litorea]|uniref:Aminotransferase n=2 Tax=Yoonia litorea TaxID=1123755 RepID=A0A1I6N0H2_9RHOB|nr:L-threonine O-3-phosphate decarboxylase [Yoonia litorea]
MRDHGGGIDAAIARFGGKRCDWSDLSTGINPVPYPMPGLPDDAWTALPDKAAFANLAARARTFWNVPAEADIIAATGASAIIAAIPHVLPKSGVFIPGPTYNEHGAAFVAAGWQMDDSPDHAMVAVHPNNPDGYLWEEEKVTAPYLVIDESFCDIMPDASLIHMAARPNTLILKSFGKFWGMAGLRLGFAIGDPVLVARLRDLLGPWQVSGPALAIGAEGLADPQWADDTRARLGRDSERLDRIVTRAGAELIGGTSLFRLYQVENASHWQDKLAQNQVWSRVFPYNPKWLRLGLPAPDRWAQLEEAL